MCTLQTFEELLARLGKIVVVRFMDDGVLENRFGASAAEVIADECGT